MVKPSRKIVPIIIGAATIVGLVALFVSLPSQNKSQKPLPTLTVVSQIKSIQNKTLEVDSDNDGLKDWEEALWNTDPHNPDTAGDGMTDGQKVKEGRNPLLAGPNNFLKNNPFATSTASSTSGQIEQPSATSLFAQDLFTQYMALKKAGKEITPEMQQDLINQVVNSGQASQAFTTAKVYSQADIKVSADNSPAAIKKYGNALGKLYGSNAQPPENNELYVVYTAVQNNDRQIIKKLDIMVTVYSNIITGLQKMPVPSQVANEHVNLLNDFSHTLNAVKAFQKIFDDPIAAIPGFDEYNMVLKQITPDENAIKAFLAANNVHFDSTEPGSLFNQ